MTMQHTPHLPHLTAPKDELSAMQRQDGPPFTSGDENIIVALPGQDAVTIENTRLHDRLRADFERFQRLLMEPDVSHHLPLQTAGVYRPAGAPHQLGGDWYDALAVLNGDSYLVVGDVCGHDLAAAAVMSQTRNMLRALLHTRISAPSRVLNQLDYIIEAFPHDLPTTVLLARIQEHCGTWRMQWSTAGHLPPLLLTPGRPARYLHADPDLPLGVDCHQTRHDHHHLLTPGSILIFYTDGLIEDPGQALTEGLAAFADLAASHADDSLDQLCRSLADEHPGNGHDDIALLAVSIPKATRC